MRCGDTSNRDPVERPKLKSWAEGILRLLTEDNLKAPLAGAWGCEALHDLVFSPHVLCHGMQLTTPNVPRRRKQGLSTTDSRILPGCRIRKCRAKSNQAFARDCIMCRYVSVPVARKCSDRSLQHKNIYGASGHGMPYAAVSRLLDENLIVHCFRFFVSSLEFCLMEIRPRCDV